MLLCSLMILLYQEVSVPLFLSLSLSHSLLLFFILGLLMRVQAPAGMNVSEDNGFFSFSYFIILGMLERSIFLNVTTVGFTATGKCVS